MTSNSRLSSSCSSLSSSSDLKGKKPAGSLADDASTTAGPNFAWARPLSGMAAVRK
jgi:hypothetical protein